MHSQRKQVGNKMKQRGRCQRGILGRRKESKNQMLFSFSVRPGEEWSDHDDSDDSDYEVGDKKSEEQQHRPVMKRKHGKCKTPWRSRSSSRKNRKNDEGVEPMDESMECGHELWADGLPNEILLHIFSIVVSKEGSLPFLCR